MSSSRSMEASSDDASYELSNSMSIESSHNSKRETPMPRSYSPSTMYYQGHRPQKVHHASLETIDEAAIQQGCAEFLKNVQTPFKGFGNKLKRICSDLTSTCDAERLDGIRNAIAQVYRHRIHHALHLPTYKPFQALCTDLLNKDKDYVDSLWQGNMSSYSIQFRNQEGVGEGVTRTALQMIIDEIDDTKFFVPAEQGSARYVVNPAITEDYLDSLGYFILGEDTVRSIYKQIGAIMALCTRYDIPIPFSLSRGILANLIYRHSEIDEDEYVMYYLLDMPQMASSLVTMLQHPSSIKDALADTEFNDYYPLVKNKDNKTITTENFKEYMRLLAKHQLTHQHAVGANDTYENLRAFLSGFYIRSKLRQMSVTVSELDRLMHGQVITENTIRHWLTPDRIVSDSDAPEHQQILLWLKQIISSGGKDFPLDAVDAQPHSSSTSKHKKTEFLNFMGKLMYFWSGVRKLNPSKQYQVIFIETVLPMASTCFYQLKLPYTVQNKGELYRKLVTAVYNVEQGVGLYGGKKHKKK